MILNIPKNETKHVIVNYFEKLWSDLLCLFVMNYELIGMVCLLGWGEKKNVIWLPICSKYLEMEYPQVQCPEILKERSEFEIILIDENWIEVNVAGVGEMSRDFEISKSAVAKSLTFNKLNTYHVKLYQKLIEADFLREWSFLEQCKII